METNEHILKLSGKACIPEGLELSHNYRVIIDGEVTAVTESNNQDGTLDKYYKFEPVLATLVKDNGEAIKAKDNRRISQKIRNLLYKYWMEDKDPREFEDAYEVFGKQVLMEMNEIYERSKK